MTSMTQPARRRTPPWKYPLLALIVALPVLLAIGLTRDPSHLPSALEGEAMPAFELPYLDGGGVLASEELTGQPLVLNFWASWCTSCRQEHDDLLRLGLQSVAAGTFRVVGVNYRDDPGRAGAYLAREGSFPYPSGVDPDGRLGIDFGVYGMPETFFVDASGVVRRRHAGPLTPEVLARALPEIGVTP